MESYSVEAKLKATGADAFAKSFEDASKGVQGFVDNNKKTFDSFKKVGAAATIAGTAVATGLGFAVSKAAEFEGGMSKVAAISGATGGDLQELSDIAREMGSTTSFSASEAAEGLEYMALAGWDNAQMLSGLEPVLHLAEAGALDLGTASDLVTDSMAAMGIEVDDLDGYLDKVAATSANANTDIDALMEAFVIAGGTFDRLNVPLEESNAFLGVLANRGTKGAEAGTAINAIMTRLTKSGGPASEALEGMGIAAFDSEGQFRGMETILKEVEVAMSGMTDEQRANATEMIAGLNHGKSFEKMINGLGDEYDGLKEDVTNSNGALKEMRDIMKDNLQGELENLSSAFDEVMISIGKALLPAVKKLVAAMQGLANWFNGLSGSTKQFIAIGAAVVAVFLLIVGPILLLIGFIPMIIAWFSALGVVFGAVGAAIGAISLPIALIVAAIIAAAALIYIYWEPISEFFIWLWGVIKDAGIAVWEWLKVVWQTTVNWFMSVWEPIAEFFTSLWESVTEIFTSAWEGLTEMLSTVWEGIKEVASGAWELIKTAILAPILLLIMLVTGDMEGFKASLAAIWEKIKESASKIWEGLKKVVMALVDVLVDNVSKSWKWLKEKSSDILDGIKKIASDAWNKIVETVKELAGKAKDGAIKAWETLKTKTTDAFNKVVDFIKDPLKNIDLYQIGKDIIQGMINGVGAMGSAAWNAAKGIASSVKDSITGFFGVKSPSRVMMEIGGFLGKGLADGIGKSDGIVSKAANKMADAAMIDTPSLAMDMDVTSQVNGIHRRSNRQMTYDLNNEMTVSKQPAYINVSLGGQQFEAFVGDISEVQERKVALEKSFR